MNALGIPPRLTLKWMHSLDAMVRYWDISQITSEVLQVSDGCPEGDSWSVVAMLSTAHVWSSLMDAKAPTSSTTSYADNWTVWTPDADITATPATCTAKYVSWMGLEISWNKTWLWSTSSTGAQKLQSCLQTYFPTQDTPIQVSATDLGCQLTYHGNAKLGVMVERFEHAKQRLEVIRQSNWLLPHKIHVIQAAVLPLALYGAELMAVGQKPLLNLRTAIVDAIVGEHVQTLSSAIFMQFVDKRDLDPFFRVILLAAKQARKFLRHANEASRTSFLQIVSSPSQHAGLTQGPASALREYLQRIGLSCDAKGEIMMTALRDCNLITSTWSDLRDGLRRNWQSHVLMHHTQRPKLYNLSPINQDDTIRLLKKYKPKQQLLLLREMAGGYQTKTQQAHWNESDGVCSFCHAEMDSKVHRTFTCAAFQEVRQPFEPFLTELFEMNADLVELPAIHLHPHHEFHDKLLHSMPMPELDVGIINKLTNLGISCPTFYTDGSCKHPTSPSTCYSAFAIVCDLTITESQRKDFACTFRYTGKIPWVFQTVAVGRTFGKQSIHRAELQALLVLFEQLDKFHVYTDSAAAIACIELCRKAVDLEELAEHDDFDLLRRFFHLVSPEKQVSKIKAHQNLQEIRDDVKLFHALGNHVADQTANAAVTQLLPEIAEQLEVFHQDLSQQTETLKQFFDLNLQLQTARAKMSQQDEDAPLDMLRDKQTLFCQWTVDQPWPFPANIGDEELANTAWSLQWSVAILEWFEHCQWPSEPRDDDPGLAWAEMALSLVLQQQMWLPVKRLRQGTELILQAVSPSELEALQTTLAEQATVMYSMVTQTFGLVEKRLVPEHVKMGKVRSLYWQGHTAWSTGFQCRPAFSNQKDVYLILQKLFLNGQGEGDRTTAAASGFRRRWGLGERQGSETRQDGPALLMDLKMWASAWLSAGFSFARLLDCDPHAFVPVPVPLWSVRPDGLRPQNLYEASALPGLALDTALMPCRLRGSLRPSHFISQLAPNHQPCCGLLQALPLPSAPAPVVGEAPGSNDTLEAHFQAGAFFDLSLMPASSMNPYTSVVLRSPEQRRLLNFTRTSLGRLCRRG
eukprot:s4409_g3.t1